VAEEVEGVLRDRAVTSVTVEELRRMRTLNAVLKETLRLYPSAPGTLAPEWRGGVFCPAPSCLNHLCYLCFFVQPTSCLLRFCRTSPLSYFGGPTNRVGFVQTWRTERWIPSLVLFARWAWY
jgi:Cytochrome P450